MRASHAFSVSIVLGFAVACGVEVDVDNKACPCGAGYTCDTLRNVCVKTGTPLTIATKPACDPCSCEKDADCTDATRPFCAPAGTGGAKICAECNPAADKCRDGTYCNAKFQCVSGCQNDAYCNTISPGTTCNTTRHQCVQCVTDEKCGAQKCSANGSCVDTCDNAAKKCPTGQDCCGGLCIPTATDIFNCGKCDNACTSDNGTPQCVDSACTQQCADGFATCPGGTGCETQVRTDPNNCGSCGHVCTPDVVLNADKIICVSGKCSESGCKPGFADADHNGENGCEAVCGAKGQPCCANNTCNGGGLSCHNGTCSPGGGQQ